MSAGGDSGGFIKMLKGIIGADCNPGHAFHAEPLNQEKWVAWSATVLFFLYFGLEFWFAASRNNLFDEVLNNSAFFPNLYDTLVLVWKTRVVRIFVVADILLILLGMYALVNVWPLKQGIKLFFIKPHSHGGHGHEDGGHAHDAHATAPQAPKRAGNPATLKHWTSIVHRANTGTPENLRWAVMEADALVDHVLRQRGVTGESMSERLQNARWAGSKIIDKVFDAHRLRNELAHTPGYQMSSQQAEKALFSFRDFLKELKEF
jgi:hypothetical protein